MLPLASIEGDVPTGLGQPVLAKGIALSKIHHAAFDNHLTGIDADGRVPRLRAVAHAA
jgi:putative restriction endonuclease